MLMLSVLDFLHGERSAVFSSKPEPVSMDGAYLIANWTDRRCEKELLALAALWGSRLLVPEVWQRILPQAGLLISSALSGGDLSQRFREAPKRRCWLLSEPMKTTFSLPCPTGHGTPIREIPQKTSFFSEALCCRYIHEPGSVILFDTEETMTKKIALAKETGFLGIVTAPVA